MIERASVFWSLSWLTVEGSFFKLVKFVGRVMDSGIYCELWFFILWNKFHCLFTSNVRGRNKCLLERTNVKWSEYARQSNHLRIEKKRKFNEANVRSRLSSRLRSTPRLPVHVSAVTTERQQFRNDNIPKRRYIPRRSYLPAGGFCNLNEREKTLT